jgi:hypothetical protein
VLSKSSSQQALIFRYTSPVGDLAPPRTTTPLSISPRRQFNDASTSHKDLPTIINTPHSPENSSPVINGQPRRPSRSPDRSPPQSNPATISDLTEMLGGAIEAIGGDVSAETSPPSASESRPKREKPDLTIGPLAPAAEVEAGPITPNSLPMRGMSLGENSKAPLRRIPSSKSVEAGPSNPSPPTAVTPSLTKIAARPWPAAMLYGHVKGMKNAGDRAKGYARAINDLSKAETGLREWCNASGMSRGQEDLTDKPSIDVEPTAST